ncbi:MAG: GNAT family N-acetyltransferase [Chitinophagales bacterium]
MLRASLVQDRNELREIADLQKRFLRGVTSQEEEREQGFLTVEHSLETLEQMHRLEPSIIAKENGQLAGYALTMPRACGAMIPVLVPMFHIFPEIVYGYRPINDYNFYVMGQICVDKPFRGLGVFDLLYQKHREVYSHKYDFIVTEISLRNHRSMKAHQRVGFKLLHVYTDPLDEWAVVIWDWRTV